MCDSTAQDSSHAVNLSIADMELIRVCVGSVQVHCAGYGMVGERLALEVASKAGAAVAGGTLTVTAGYREGLGAPRLLSAPARGVPAGEPFQAKLSTLRGSSFGQL